MKNLHNYILKLRSLAARVDAISRDRGFGLVEILVSAAIFALVISAGTASVLSTIDANQKAQSINSVMSNLNIVLEGMARNIRVGTDYANLTTGDPSSGIYFFSDIGEDIEYRRAACSARTAAGCIFRRVGGTGAWEQVTSFEVDILDLNFYVDTTAGVQPKVRMVVRGKAETQAKTGTEFYLQTMMSQRLIEDTGTSTEE